MATQRKKNQSIFPDFPRHTPMVDKDGRLTATWHLSLASLYQALQTNFSNEGFAIPPLSDGDMSTIQAIYTPLIGSTLQSKNPTVPNISGQMAYNTTNHVPKMFIIEFSSAEDPTSTITAASWKTFTVT